MDLDPTTITVEATIDAPIEKVWEYWTEPEHIMQWNNASDDWHTPAAANDLRPGGQFNCTMAAKDGSFSFEFGGTYDEVDHHKLITYTMGDGRKVRVEFEPVGDSTKITETFEPESENPHDMQRDGWQAILNNFKKHAERM
jgi:uncharacterized protein YndB with AHSA1/START domain